MQLLYTSYSLAFRHPFKIASGRRTHTPSVIVKLSHKNIDGYGEATLPPYLPETQQSVISFIESFRSKFSFDENDIEKNLKQLHVHSSGNYFAKAAIDIALYDWHSKAENMPVHSFLKINPSQIPFCTFTIGFDSDEIIKQKISEAVDFTILKIKLGTEDDKKYIKTIRAFTNKPICVDVNQGWKNTEQALDMIYFLKENNCLFIEQPLPKSLIEEQKKLFEKSPLPIIADEALQTIDDLAQVKSYFHGVNIKLMKCGGINKALELINESKKHELKILIGCMSESSCGVSAAAQLSPLADWVDLDGPLLISNDPFTGINYSGGKILLSNKEGLGVMTRIEIED